MAPGSIQHVIARFVDREYRLADERDRRAYLACLARAALRTDSSIVAYAMMSSHVHLALIAGHRPLVDLIRPAHTAAAMVLNRTQARLGPVFAERPLNIETPLARAGHLIAYLHNNPVRAAVAATAMGSPWTSHRAYLGAADPPPWLDVRRGLSLCGLDASRAGREAFDAMVVAREGDTRDATLATDAMCDRRTRVRRGLGTPAEIATPAMELARLGTVIRLVEGAPVRPRWCGSLDAMLGLVAETTGTSADALRGRGRVRNVVDARRLAIRVAVDQLGRTVTEAGAVVGLSVSAASRLLHREVGEYDALAGAIGNACWRGTGT